MKTKLGLSDFFLLIVVGGLITFIGFAIDVPQEWRKVESV